MENKMTAPTEQKGLFEALQESKDATNDLIFWCVNGPKICTEFEQRLSDANNTIDDLRFIEREKTDQLIAANFARTQLSEQLASAHQEARDQQEVAQRAMDELNRRAPEAGQDISCEYCGLVGGDHLWNCPMIAQPDISKAEAQAEPVVEKEPLFDGYAIDEIENDRADLHNDGVSIIMAMAKYIKAQPLYTHPQQPAEPQEPVAMVLHCPKCGEQHVDAPEEFKGNQTGNDEAESEAYREWLASDPWLNPPHKSHLCHACGNIWRPADIATNGVASIKTKGKADNWDGQTQRPAVLAAIELAQAAVAYDEAIQSCANDPAAMSSFCSAQGESLDRLYESWIFKARCMLAPALGMGEFDKYPRVRIPRADCVYADGCLYNVTGCPDGCKNK